MPAVCRYDRLRPARLQLSRPPAALPRGEHRPGDHRHAHLRADHDHMGAQQILTRRQTPAGLDPDRRRILTGRLRPQLRHTEPLAGTDLAQQRRHRTRLDVAAVCVRQQRRVQPVSDPPGPSVCPTSALVEALSDRQLECKTGWYGTDLVVADRWFASSKTCSDCGVRNGELKRGQTSWVCQSCGVRHDRDVGAANRQDGRLHQPGHPAPFVTCRC